MNYEEGYSDRFQSQPETESIDPRITALYNRLEELYRTAQQQLEQNGEQEEIYVSLQTPQIPIAELPANLHTLLELAEADLNGHARAMFGHFNPYERFPETYSFTLQWSPRHHDKPNGSVIDTLHVSLHEKPLPNPVKAFWASDSQNVFRSNIKTEGPVKIPQVEDFAIKALTEISNLPFLSTPQQ